MTRLLCQFRPCASPSGEPPWASGILESEVLTMYRGDLTHTYASEMKESNLSSAYIVQHASCVTLSVSESINGVIGMDQGSTAS